MTSLAGRRHRAGRIADRGHLALGLARAVRGEVRFDRGSQALYANDASVYRQIPIGVVIPRDAEDVLAALAVCREHEVPVLARGCSTGLQMVFLGNPEYGVNMAPLDFVKFAEACGARGIRIDDPKLCAQQMAEALAWDGPAIIECVVDEHEPPYPAKVKKDQVTKLTTALREGTPNRRRIALQMVRDLLDESSFDASPAHAVPGPVGKAAAKIAGKLQGNDRQEP